jgi:hypothetical protein
VSHRPTPPVFGLKSRILAMLLAAGSCSTAAHAQNPVTTFPKNYSLIFSNSAVAVIRVHYGPHEKIGLHDHSETPTVYVYLSDSGPVRFQHVEEKSFALTRPPTAKGAFRVSPGRLERHSVENMGDVSSDFLRVELKQILLGGLEPFRGKAPHSLLQSQNSVEFTTPALEIQRILCVGSLACSVKPSAAPSLIIAFTPLYLATGVAEKQGEKLEAGAVRWLPSSEAARVTPDAASPAHLLRILIPTARM